LISSGGFGRLVVALVTVCGAVASGNFRATSPTPADFVVLHGRIYTVNPQQRWAEALAISRDKIVAVGSDKEIAEYRGARTQTIDAAGQVVLPGFTDSHNHFLEGSLSLDDPDLNDARSASDMRQILKNYESSHPGTGWVFGQGWSYDAFGVNGLPDKRMLDEIFPSRPVYLESFDGHTGWVNNKALALAHITRDTPDPPTGKIVRDASTKDATGVLKEDARHLVKSLIPPPAREDKLASLRKGLALANHYGLVRVHAAGEPPDTFGDFFDLDLFEQLRREGHLTVRFYVSRVIDPPELASEALASLENARNRYHDEWISVGAAKFFLDGVIEAHTAAMLSPYSDDPRISGSTLWAADKFNPAVAELDRRGFQIFTHAIGDRAVRLALDAYQRAELANGRRDARHRIEHIEIVSSEDIPRFASLNVIASMQPLHAYPDAGVWSLHVGTEREKLGFAWNSLQKAGARLAFGSDWEVVTMNPWPGIQCAVTRQTDEGQPKGGWIPEQRISVAQAIAGYTIGAAYAGHRETMEGSLEPGKLADLVIVSQNPFEIDPLRIGKTEVILTMVGGRVVYRSTDERSPSRSTARNIPGAPSNP
jgi:predicted amidohydrolase YtcJ